MKAATCSANLHASNGDEVEEEIGRYAVKIRKDTARDLRNISGIAGRLHKLLISEPVNCNGDERKQQAAYHLGLASNS